MLDTFNNIYFDLDEDLFLNDSESDDPRPVINVILCIKPPYESYLDLIKSSTRYIRILGRKPSNYKNFDFLSLTYINTLFSLRNSEVSIDLCHILLRILSYLPFLKIVLQNPESLYSSLYQCLQNTTDQDLSVTSAAAFQSFAFHQIGKRYICGKNTHIKAISMIMERSITSPLSVRLIGFLHNMSSEAEVVISIRESGAIKEILKALKVKPISSLTVDAAGLVQNLARESESRKILLESNALDSLLELIVLSDMQAQVRAVGAIMNLLGPSCDDVNALKQALARMIALSALGRAL
ncbi:hypothetical protein GPJ56_006432 [Histomonas meleagridis]|uniref:uncharacterized protein n=1 Tax=Histomonas meleagridis TaxID=135588 RepID=UPI003559DB50|nr:hypothetical protein GPJ56_006432 [Histomonas meleagridis]KAH0796752.1 hypothetical protein GO595_010645 [Histomonas meleagridis]